MILFCSTFRLLNEGLCDIRARPCMRTIVFGEYFLSSANLTCHVREVEVQCGICFIYLFIYFLFFMFSR